ncbi:hypothetical protein ACEUZ9_000303 [Paracoccus litorisediminis]|uniref:hypothetical protein n=1 Tax=Paracoccus litorisediminis TaxID=2006130 RepID=UPI00372D99D8
MPQDLSLAERFLPLLQDRHLHDVTHADDLVIAEEGKLRVLYAPFDHVNRQARVVIVGITPGLNQAEEAISVAIKARDGGAGQDGILARAKATASFSRGVMRTNMLRLLEGVGLPAALSLPSAASIFDVANQDVHLTSSLRYPVFKKNGRGEYENYNGPNPLRSPILRGMIESHLAEEARMLPDALWIPLGDVAGRGVEHLVQNGLLDERQVLSGMPHPSGANNGPIGTFLGGTPPQNMSAESAERLRMRRASVVEKIRAFATPAA